MLLQAACCCLCLVFLWRYFAYPSFFTTLRTVPKAHWSSGISPIWILWKRYMHTELAAVMAAHERLGPLVQLGPRDLSISTYEDGVRVVYGGGFEKPEYYDFFKYYGEQNAFCCLKKRDHSQCRRRVSSVYTKTAVLNSQILLQNTSAILMNDLFPRLQHHATTGQTLDALQVSYALSLDLVNSFIFGDGGSKFMQDDTALREFLVRYEEKFCDATFWPQELPNFTRAMSWIGINLLPRSSQQATRWLEHWMQEMCDKAEKICKTGSKNPPIVYGKVRECISMDSKHKTLDERRCEIGSELFDHMSSAREVLGLVLGYTIYYISRRPDAQELLRSELLSVGLPESYKPVATAQTKDGTRHTVLKLPRPELLDRLPYLGAIIKESLRMRPNSTPLPRITPSDRSVTLVGIDNIPPRTRVNTFQWALHRDPAKWVDVDVWEPDRFLKGTKLSTNWNHQDHGKNVLWPFASGSRMCVGNHLAGYLMRYVLAVIFTNFRTSIVDDADFGKYAPGSVHDRLLIRLDAI